MIFKPNMIVVLTNGRLAGKKAVVLKALENGHILVAGINRIPTLSEEFMTAAQKRKNEKFLTFIKKVNVNHVLATRYRADIGLTALDINNSIQDLAVKRGMNEEANKIMKNAYESKKAKWLFTSLKF